MKYIFFFITVFLTLFPVYALSEERTAFKLAVFDNPEIDSTNALIAQDLSRSYTQGISTAIAMAKKRGFVVTEKNFFYGNNLLDVMQVAPNVKKWNPDVVMGLNSSNAFLMSKNFFDDMLVLSISATDVHLSTLPNNFYSIGTPDLYAVKAFTAFIDQYYPNRNLFFIIGAESKESVDLASLLANYYTQKHPQQRVTQSMFLSDDINTMNIKKLVSGYKPGDIVLFFSIDGTYNTQVELMNKISTFLTPNKLVFITSVDNWSGRNILANTNNTKNPYTAYRVDTSYVDTDSKEYKLFNKKFKEIFHDNPKNSISFITYQAVISVIDALKKYPSSKNLNAKQSILFSYQQALKYHPNWFRPDEIVVYKLNGNQEVYFTTLQNRNDK